MECWLPREFQMIDIFSMAYINNEELMLFGKAKKMDIGTGHWSIGARCHICQLTSLSWHHRDLRIQPSLLRLRPCRFPVKMLLEVEVPQLIPIEVICV